MGFSVDIFSINQIQYYIQGWMVRRFCSVPIEERLLRDVRNCGKHYALTPLVTRVQVLRC